MIETQDICKQFDGRQVLQDVTLRADDGQVTGFIGPNGAGKSTLMKIILGLIPQDSGTTRIDGLAYHEHAAPMIGVGSMISAEWLPARMTAEGILRYACETHALEADRIGKVLEAVGLATVARRRIGGYSLGMRQRLGIGLALLGEPRNLVLDEPVNGLDPNGVLWLRGLLRAEADRGTAVLLSSHLMSELELVADRVVMLSAGKVVREGAIGELKRDERGVVYIESPDLESVVASLRREGIDVERSGAGARVASEDPLAIGRIAFAAGAGLTHLSAETESLEEMFLSSTVGEYTAREGM